MKEPKDKKIGKCECGGVVRGVEEHGRLFTYCEKCTPVRPIFQESAVLVGTV